MIKIKLFEHEIHRNETSYRPLVFIKELLSQVGIELVTDSLSYDFVIVGQASIADKKLSLNQSVEMGVKKLESIKGDYIIIDGQDASTLIGTIDVFRHVYKNSNCKLFLKPSYLKDFDLYKKSWTLGRMYWGEGEYSVPDIDDMKPKMKLIGYNWLSTIQPKWENKPIQKIHDVWAYFQYPMNKDVYEHSYLQSAYYDRFRKGLHDKLEKIESKYKVLRMKDGLRVSLDEYYQMMIYSKIIIAAFGYGEMAPRDIESSIFGNILFKNDMSHLLTIPNIYIPFQTYIPVAWDWSDVEEKIDNTLSNLETMQKELPTNMRDVYISENNPVKRVIYFYDLIKNIDNVEVV